MMLVTTAAKIAPRVALALLWPAALFGQQANSQPQYVPTDELHAKLLSGSPPAWPPEAVSKNMEGSLRIRFVVTKEGAVENELYLIGNTAFASAAEKAISSRRYEPILTNGTPTEIVTAISVHFYRPGHSRDTYLEKYRQSVAKQPEDAKAHELLAEELHATGYVGEAEQEYQATIKLNPRSPEPHYGLSRIFRERMDFVPSVTEFRKGVALEPTNQEAHLRFADLLQDARDYAGAIAEYREGMRLGPTYPTTNYLIGRCYVMKGDPDAAIPELQTALKKSRGFYYANYYLGRAYELKGDLPAALKQYRTAFD